MLVVIQGSTVYVSEHTLVQRPQSILQSTSLSPKYIGNSNSILVLRKSPVAAHLSPLMRAVTEACLHG
jgi:hypothetical protein